MSLKPLGPRLIVRPIKEDEFGEGRLSSGLYVPDTSRAESLRGLVLAVGPAWECRKWKAGDTVLYRENAGVEIEEENETVLLLCEHEVLCGIMAA